MTSQAIKVEAAFHPGRTIGTDAIAEQAARLEELGFDRAYVAETNRDGFLPLMLAAHTTSSIELGTGIAVAFARNPMNIAMVAHDLNAYSQGRFRLGLGSQIKPHITRRFSMPWHGAAKQMREFIEAIHAIWDSWFDGTPLDYQGEFYQYSLMTPEFSPATDGLRRPPILLAAVGPLMVKTAAEVADGLIVHPFCTEHYLKDVIVPRLEPALDARGRSLDDFEIQYPVFVASGESEEQFEKAKAAIKYRIGFYGSTPAYKPVLDLHGWGDLQPMLRTMTKENKWDQLGGEISDEMLETFAVVGEPHTVAATIRARFGGVIDSVVLDPATPPETLTAQMEALRGQ
ncbi:MAG: TIGR03617 family F420-dependent LLM class oxidoreductase [Actinomycetota bacterium]